MVGPRPLNIPPEARKALEGKLVSKLEKAEMAHLRSLEIRLARHAEIGARLRKLRNLRGLSLRGMADLCRLAYTHIHSMEVGKDPWTREAISDYVYALTSSEPVPEKPIKEGLSKYKRGGFTQADRKKEKLK